MLKDRVNQSNLAALSSRKGRNGAKIMTQTSKNNDEGDFIKQDEEANWEGLSKNYVEKIDRKNWYLPIIALLPNCSKKFHVKIYRKISTSSTN